MQHIENTLAGSLARPNILSAQHFASDRDDARGLFLSVEKQPKRQRQNKKVINHYGEERGEHLRTQVCQPCLCSPGVPPAYVFV